MVLTSSYWPYYKHLVTLFQPLKGSVYKSGGRVGVSKYEEGEGVYHGAGGRG
jgi:hypothetical protein